MPGQDGDLAGEDLLGPPRLPLVLGLADARDDREPGLERRLGPAAHVLVRLAEELAALGVAHERPRRARLEQHRRGDLAREGALELPVDVLAVDAHRAPLAEPAHRGLDRHERRAHDDLDAVRALGQVPDLGGEQPRLVRPLEHLPVAGDQHEARS